MHERIGLTGLPPANGREHEPGDGHAAEALRLTGLGIPVAAGTWLTVTGRCSCGDRECRDPGGHPRDPRWPVEATTDPRTTAHRWRDTPHAALIVSLTGSFQVVDVAAEVGALALGLLAAAEQQTPPVAVTPRGRYQFWVRSETAQILAHRMAGAGRAALRLRTTGRHVVAPPHRYGPFRWQHRPTTPPERFPAGPPLLDALAVSTATWRADTVRRLSPSRWM